MPTSFSIAFGTYAEPSWVGMKVIVRRSAPYVDGSGNVSEVTWSTTVAPDGTASITGLPYNDDGSTYSAEWQALSYLPTPGNRVFQVLSSSGITTQDFDSLAASPTVPGVSVPVINAHGIPAGGASGQVLAKASATDYDAAWVAQTGGGGGGAVASVNGHVGAVVLSASDVGADASGAATTAQAAAISAAATDATTKANAAQAAAVQRANHTGTQSADTITDGTTNKAYTATEKTKLAGVATGATANATDVQLRDRSTHTGTQAAATVTGLATVATSGAYPDLTGKPALGTVASHDATEFDAAGAAAAAQTAAQTYATGVAAGLALVFGA